LVWIPNLLVHCVGINKSVAVIVETITHFDGLRVDLGILVIAVELRGDTVSIEIFDFAMYGLIEPQIDQASGCKCGDQNHPKLQRAGP